MAGVGGVNPEVGQWRAAGVHGAMGGMARHIDDPAGSERFEPRGPGLLVFQDHETLAGLTDVNLGRLAGLVQVAFCQEIFPPDFARIENSQPVVKVTRAIRRFHGNDPIQNGIVLPEGRLIGRGIGKASFQVGKTSYHFLAAGESELAGIELLGEGFGHIHQKNSCRRSGLRRDFVTNLTHSALSNMLSSAPERQRRILEILVGQEFARNADLARHLRVTAMTLWRDLVALEEKGLVRRTRGRVSRASWNVVEPDFASKADVAHAAKARIAAYAARHLISDGDNLALDGGTTVAAIARETLPAGLTILTNSLHTARLFLSLSARPAVYACGGLLREQSGTFIGREALTFFARRRTHRYFLTATGVDRDAGVTDLTLEDNEVKRAMASGAKEVVLLADRTKFGTVSLMRVLPWRRIHRFVTDARGAEFDQFALANPHLVIHQV